MWSVFISFSNYTKTINILPVPTADMLPSGQVPQHHYYSRGPYGNHRRPTDGVSLWCHSQLNTKLLFHYGLMSAESSTKPSAMFGPGIPCLFVFFCFFLSLLILKTLRQRKISPARHYLFIYLFRFALLLFRRRKPASTSQCAINGYA